jgi:HAE1 family hydrophobic/amphiphilic exporter-1
VDVATLGSTLNLLVSGEQSIGDYMENGRQSNIKVRLLRNFRDRPEDLENIIVYNRHGDPFEVSSFANVELSSGSSQIDHMDKMRSVTISANVSQGNTIGDASFWLENNINNLMLPGIRYRVVGEAEIMAESFASMATALLLAIMLIYVILAAQFNNFIHPLTIMMSVPLAFIGAFGLLYLTGMSLTMFALIGVIMLMGLVTKNAILVVEFTNQLRERGMERDEALMTAGPIRLRPVLMTTLSTIGGMLPVALMLGHGAGVEMRAPMAVAVIGGLGASTLLTLVVVPVVYALLDQATSWFLRKFHITDTAEPMITNKPDDQV